MKVIVASQATQGTRTDDFSWTLEGELVHLPPIECASGPACGCERSFVGVASQRATTTAEVAERELAEDDVVRAVYDALVDGSYVEPEVPGQRREGQWLAYALVADLLELADRTPVGTVLGRRRDRFLVRSMA